MLLGGQDLPRPSGLAILCSPLHVLLRVKARCNPRWHATKVPADFWLEDEEAYKVRNKTITAGALVLMIANSQGAEKFRCPTRTHLLEREVRHMGVVEYQDPYAHDFPLGGMSSSQHARFTPRFRLPKAFPDNKSGTRVLTDAAAMNGAPDNHVFEDINVEFPGRHGRAHDPKSFSYLDGSAKKVDGSPKGNGPEQGRQDPEAAGIFTGTGLIMAHSQEVLRIDPRGKNTTNTIYWTELVGVQAWLKQVSQLESPTATTFKLLTDSQVTLQSFQMAIKQPATTWLCTHEPLLKDIMANLKVLTEAGHHVHLDKVKAHAGVAGNILADAAAKIVVTQKIIDADGNLNDIPNEDLAEAGIESTCNVSNNAHEHHEWPVYPIPEHEGVDMKALLEMRVLLQEGTWPDGFSPEERKSLAWFGSKVPSSGIRCLPGWCSRRQVAGQKYHDIALQDFEEILPTRIQRSRFSVCQAVAECQSYAGASHFTPVLGTVHKKLPKAEDLHC